MTSSFGAHLRAMDVQKYSYAASVALGAARAFAQLHYRSKNRGSRI